MEEELNITNIVNNEIKPVEQLQLNLQKQATAKQQGTSSLYDSLQSSYFGGTGIQQTAVKPSIEFQVPIEEGYKLVGDEYVSKFPTYQAGRDNYEYAAQNQSTFDKWTNGLTKAGANLLTTIAGNTVGFVIGAAEGAKEGSWNAVFDNKFSNSLADWNEKLSYQLPNYVTKDEQDNNFFQGLGTANFWANDVAGGFSFTLGTIASEAIWAYATGGIANSAKWGARGAEITNKLRWGKVALGAEEAAVGVANYKKFLASGLNKLYRTGSLETGLASTFATTAKTLNTARFLATTSANEAGIEALHYKREQRENFYRNFEMLNGRPPSEGDIEIFENNLENSANAVFATNMAILAPSNIAMYGSLFNINNPVKGLAKAMNKSLFGIGVEKVAGEAGEIAYRGLQATGRQKIAQYTYAALKPLLTEGIWEEGLQGVTTKSAENWIETTYNPKYTNQTISLSDATYKAFAEQYGTKEGWKEIGIGAIIGLGSSLVIGKGNLQEVREFQREQQYQQDYVAKGLNQFGDQSALAADTIVRGTMLSSRINNAVEIQKEAIDKGDDVQAALAQQDMLLAEMQFRKSIGENVKDLVSKYTTAINALPEESFQELGIEDIQTYKDTVIASYKGLVNSYENASDFADAVLGDSKILGQDIQTQTLKDALTYSIVSGEKANKAMDGILQQMGQIIGEDSIKSLQIQTDLQKLGKNKQQQVRRLNSNITQAENEVKALSEQLQTLQVSKDESKGARLQQVQRKLNSSTERLAELKSQREVLAQEVSQESKRRRSLGRLSVDSVSLNTEFITGEDLANIDEKLQKIEDSIKSYEGVNHALYYDLLDLKRQYNSAKNKFFSFQKSVDAIVNGNLKLKFSKMNGLLGKIFNSNAPIDDFTGDYLNYINENYEKSVGQQAYDIFTEKIISDEDYIAFQETGEVTEEVINSIASKVKNAEVLTQRENEIFQAKADEINTLLTPNPNKPDLSPVSAEDAELQNLEEKRRELEQSRNAPENISSMSQDDFAVYLQANYSNLSQDQLYKLLTVRSELREAMLNESGEKWAERFEKNADYRQQHNNIDNNKELQGTSNPAWTGITVNDPTNKSEEGRHKGYVTVTSESARELAKNVEKTFKDLYAELKNAGYNGYLKMPSTFSDLLTRFDNIVIHGATEADVDLALPIIEKYLAENSIEVESTKKGIDAKNKEGKETSHTNLLAEKIKNKELSTTDETRNELNNLDKRINEIKRGKGILTPAEELRDAINKTFEKDYPMLTQDVDEMVKEKPTEEEKDRYQTLYKLRDNFTEKEAEEFSILQPRMQRWFMAESLPVAGNTIADLIELLDQLETQINRDETLTEISDDLLAQETAEQKSANSTVRQDILQNISGNAVTKVKDNDIYFMHINPRTVLDPLILNSNISTVQTVNSKGNLNKAQDLTESLLNSEIKKPGTVFTIGGIKITIGEKGSTVMSLDDYNSVKDIINLYYFDSNSGKWSYADLYERLADGTTRKKASEFETNTVSDYIYEAKEGDSLNLFVDMKTDFNRDLIYQSLEDIEKNGSISDELKKQILNTLEITSRQQNKNNSTLKAMYSDVEFDNFAYVRKKYADKFIELLETEQGLATLPNKIDLEADLSVKEIFLGTPNFQLNEANAPIEQAITERGLEQIITQGYVKGTEMFLGDKSVDTGDISRLYVTNLVKANPELKIPVVILNKGVHQFAFPITMIKVVENREQALDDILSALETNTEATKAINNLMISLGLDTRIVQLTQENLDRIRTELQNYEAFRTADELADTNYNKNSLIQDATIKIDLEDTLISSPKITVDYSTLTIGNAEETENDAISLRQDIVNDLREIERIINRTPEIPDRNNLVQAFDENAVENKGTDIMNRKDINFIRKVFFTEDGKVKTVRGTAVDIIGRDKIYRLGEKLKTLQFYENQIKTIKDKNVERNLNCN